MKKFLLILTVAALVLATAPPVPAEGDIFTYSLLPDGSYEVASYKGSGQEQVNIPTEYMGDIVSSVGKNCFTSYNGDEAVYHPEIRKITVPYTVSSIGENAFAGTSWISDPATSDENGFIIINGILVKYTGTATVLTVPDNIRTVNYGAFAGNPYLTGIKFPFGLTKILGGAFAGCENLNAADIPDTVVYIGEGAFRGTGFLHLTLPGSISEIAPSLFCDCVRLKNVTFSGAVASVGKYAFCNCSSLETVSLNGSDVNVFPSCVRSIGYGAFFNCSSLQSVSIGPTVSSVGELAFINCVKLSDIYVSEAAGTEGIGEYAFGFYLLREGESYTPIRIATTVHVAGSSLGRTATPVIKYCYSSAKDGIFAPVNYTVSYETLLGDTDGDGKITASDARLILRHSADLEPVPDKYVIDINLDGRVTAGDARRALRMAAGLDHTPETLEATL